ncbi:MAG: adenosylmethionine decarboxylase [Candidatus Micrarchaeia archaeon]
MEAVEKQVYKVIGKHIYANMDQIDERYLGNMDLLTKLVNESARIGRLHIVEMSVKKFAPLNGYDGGVSIIAILEESHIALHTWPESNYATLDIYTCGASSDPEAAFNYIVQKLKPKDIKVFRADRGN